MKGLDTFLRSPKLLGNCNLEKVDSSNLVGFLNDPFRRSSYFKNTIIQKYPIGFRVDKVIFLENFNLNDFAIVDYQASKIYVDESLFLYNCNDPDGSLVHIEDLRSMVSDITYEFIEKMKLDNEKDIKESPNYKGLYKKNHDSLFQMMVFSRILGETLESKNNNRTQLVSNDFAKKIILQKLVDIAMGDFEYLKKFADNLVHSNNFIEREYVLEQLKQEADEYYNKGAFVKRETAFKDFAEKMRSSSVQKLTGILEDGTIYHFKNYVTSTGKLVAIDQDFVFDFYLLDRVEANGKVIYKRI